MFKKDQKVWCAIYGAGVVKRIRQEAEVDYPVVVVFNRDDDESVVTYTAEGKYHEAGNVTLFPHPVKIVQDESATKPSIDWEHVSSKFNYLAEDADGGVFLYEDKPFTATEMWTVYNGELAEAHMLASYTKGTCDWKDSLVKRPEEETL